MYIHKPLGNTYQFQLLGSLLTARIWRRTGSSSQRLQGFTRFYCVSLRPCFVEVSLRVLCFVAFHCVSPRSTVFYGVSLRSSSVAMAICKRFTAFHSVLLRLIAFLILRFYYCFLLCFYCVSLPHTELYCILLPFPTFYCVFGTAFLLFFTLSISPNPRGSIEIRSVFPISRKKCKHLRASMRRLWRLFVTLFRSVLFRICAFFLEIPAKKRSGQCIGDQGPFL